LSGLSAASGAAEKIIDILIFLMADEIIGAVDISI